MANGPYQIDREKIHSLKVVSARDRAKKLPGKSVTVRISQKEYGEMLAASRYRGVSVIKYLRMLHFHHINKTVLGTEISETFTTKLARAFRIFFPKPPKF